jgi:predicted RNase H-like HicB family nuclease
VLRPRFGKGSRLTRADAGRAAWCYNPGMAKPRKTSKLQEFTVVIERDEDGYYVASVPALHGCYTQARTLEELAPRVREVIALCLAEQKAPRMKFVGVQQVEVSA